MNWFWYLVVLLICIKHNATPVNTELLLDTTKTSNLNPNLSFKKSFASLTTPGTLDAMAKKMIDYNINGEEDKPFELLKPIRRRSKFKRLKAKRSPEKYPLKLHLCSNRHALYGQRTLVSLAMPYLGKRDFYVNVTVNTKDYLIYKGIVYPNSNSIKWHETPDVNLILKRFGIRECNLPFKRGFFVYAFATFWDTYRRALIAMVTALDDPSKLLAKPVKRRVYVHMKRNIGCQPHLRLPYCANPKYPVALSPKAHNNFFAELDGCDDAPYEPLNWNIYDVLEEHLISTVAVTDDLVLQLVPYTIKFTYEPKTVRHFLLRVDTEVNGTLAVARCYVYYTPPPIEPIIVGNLERKAYRKDVIVLNATLSRDWAYTKPGSLMDLIWSCQCAQDKQNRYCQKRMSRRKVLKIPPNKLMQGKKYEYSLTLHSSLDPTVSKTVKQVIYPVDYKVFTPQIICKRNCALGVYGTDESVHFVAECYDCDYPIIGYEWWITVGNTTELKSEYRHLLLHYNANKILIKLIVTIESGQQASVTHIISRNWGPINGTCTINPKSGMEAETLFTIECKDFDVAYPPIEFRYMIPLGAIDSNIHYSRIKIMLPATDLLLISICDALDVCVQKDLVVNVTQQPNMSRITTLESFLTRPQYNVGKMLHQGQWQYSFIATLAAIKQANTLLAVSNVYRRIGEPIVRTGVQLEQLVLLATHLLAQLSPVDYRGAKLMAKILIKIASVFEDVIDEREWLHGDAYNTLTAMHLFFMLVLGRDSENLQRAMCKVYDIECTMGQELIGLSMHMETFDILVQLRINCWLKCTWFLYKCMYYLGVLATRRHFPYDEALTILKGGIAYQINVTERTTSSTDMTLYTIDDIHEIFISEALLHELTTLLDDDVILFQLISQQHFHQMYWWYPEALPKQRSVLIFHAYSPKKFYPSGALFTITNPLVYYTNITKYGENQEFNDWMLNSSIRSISHVHYYKLTLHKKTMLAVRIMSCTDPLRISLRFHRRPRSTEIENTGCYIPAKTSGKRIWITNYCTNANTAFVGIRSAKKLSKIRAFSQLIFKNRHATLDSLQLKNPINYSILLERYTCTSWKNRSLNPGWSSDFCTTNFVHSYGTSVKCTCNILGSLSSGIVPAAAEPFVETVIVPLLVVNWTMIALFVVLFLMLFIILTTYMTGLGTHQKESVLQCKKVKREEITISEGDDLLLLIITGGQEFAGSTSNVTLYFKSPGHKQVAYHIKQDPGKPRLKRSSTCKLTISRKAVKIPTLLAFGIEPNGRYPSWYCRSVIICDLINHSEQHFLVERWITEGTTPFMTSPYLAEGKQSHTQFSWGQRFCMALEEYFINWFLFQPICGPWLSSNSASAMNRYERSCIWICKLAVTLCFVSVYFGRTTSQSMTEDRQKNNSNSLDIIVILALTIWCYVLSILVDIFFRIIVLRLLLKR